MTTVQYQGPWRFAHRGVCQNAPENTMSAFQDAYEMGAEGLEIDIHITRDGQILVQHDDTLTRMTSCGTQPPCTQTVDALDWAQISALSLPYANHLLDHWTPAGFIDENRAIDAARQLGQDPAHPAEAARLADSRTEKFVLLSTLLDWMAGLERPLWLEIEYKAPGMMPELTRLLADFPGRDRCIIFSGNPALIEEIQQYARTHTLPDGVKLGANIRHLTPEWKARIPSMTLFEVGLNVESLFPDDIAWLRAHDILTLSNLGDFPEGWERICTCGAVGFKTNFVGPFTDWWMARQA